jgi:hypothetical protein
MGLAIQNKNQNQITAGSGYSKKTAQSETTGKQLVVFWAAI